MIKLSNFSSIFIANWKLNGNLAFIKEYYQKLSTNSNNCTIICAPAIYLSILQTNAKNLFFGAQDVSIYNEGAYTGEISAEMLKEKKSNFCLVGHSERRQYFKDSNETVRFKSINLINKNIIPVICVGETLEQKEKKITKTILSKQLEEGLPDISNYENTLIAYEPIWAIGTGLTPSLEDIQEVHEFIKQIDKKLNNFNVLYGGSVKSSNSQEINGLESVDGCLIGGASLKVEEFNRIIS